MHYIRAFDLSAVCRRVGVTRNPAGAGRHGGVTL
jgi:hypothetical protein